MDFISEPAVNKIRFHREAYEKSVFVGIVTIFAMIYLGYSSLSFATDVYFRRNPIINQYTE